MPGELRGFEMLFDALGEPTRLRILRVLSGGERCVCELGSILGMSQPRISQHLKILKVAGLVTERKEGWWSHYRLNREYLLGRLEAFAQLLLGPLTNWEDAEEELLKIRELPEKQESTGCCLRGGDGGRVRTGRRAPQNVDGFVSG